MNEDIRVGDEIVKRLPSVYRVSGFGDTAIPATPMYSVAHYIVVEGEDGKPIIPKDPFKIVDTYQAMSGWSMIERGKVEL